MADKCAINRYKKLAWEIAHESAAKNGGDSVLIYQKMMHRLEVDYLSNLESHIKSNES
jgi:hypothetical protein